ncbi:MAG: hypothetical protein JWN34_1181 [Bryobacterales bacterium]|nr:hypothetical protein [Bryobacterales bacterium]
MSDTSFTLGQSYTRQEISKKIGGPVQGMLPTVLGRVVCCCVTWDLSKQAEKQLQIGDFPHQYPAARQWARGKQSVPLFCKRQAGQWEYLGDYRVAEATDVDDDKIALVLHLEPAPPTFD